MLIKTLAPHRLQCACTVKTVNPTVHDRPQNRDSEALWPGRGCDRACDAAFFKNCLPFHF